MLKRLLSWLWLGICASLFLSCGARTDLEVRSLEEGATQPPAKIEDIAFMVGDWVGEGFAGYDEEVIMPPVGRQMAGMFISTRKDGSIGMYEFYTIREEEGSLIVRLKHFHNDARSWEEKDETVDFRLVAIEGTTAYFDGQTYSRTGPDKMEIAVRLGPGAEKIARFSMTRDKF